jgi:hypothetical protein
LQQVQAGRSQQKVAAGLGAGAAGLINQAAQHRKQSRLAVCLVEDDQFVQVALQAQLGLDQLGAVTFGIEVEVDMGSPWATCRATAGE